MLFHPYDRWGEWAVEQTVKSSLPISCPSKSTLGWVRTALGPWICFDMMNPSNARFWILTVFFIYILKNSPPRNHTPPIVTIESQNCHSLSLHTLLTPSLETYHCRNWDGHWQSKGPNLPCKNFFNNSLGQIKQGHWCLLLQSVTNSCARPLPKSSSRIQVKRRWCWGFRERFFSFPRLWWTSRCFISICLSGCCKTLDWVSRGARVVWYQEVNGEGEGGWGCGKR